MSNYPIPKEFRKVPWSELEPGSGTLVGYVVPRELP